MPKAEVSPERITLLPRGGYLVNTGVGPIQVGSPPETIKDTMLLESGVPQIFILPEHTFHWRKGINLADLEFPIYLNFFIRKKKTSIICTLSQQKQMLRALQEAVFGPKRIDVQEDLPPDLKGPDYVPPLEKEIAFFRGPLTINHLVRFCILKDGKCEIDGVKVTRLTRGGFEIRDTDGTTVRCPGTLEYKPRYAIGQRLAEPYRPPLFGVTCLGPSHGFDPTANTSGFIIWLNHTGIMVDPPVDATEWLRDSNVNPKLIDSIILTHCHADHDAGTFQKILEEGRIVVYTTRTVMESFLRKYSALSGEKANYLRQLFTFHPVRIHEPLYIHGAEFTMSYRLHSIPTIGFTLRFQGQSFVYSSDHQASPGIQEQLLSSGVITPQRHQEFQRFPWDSDVIYHESGIAPLHTPITYLCGLPEETRRRTVVYHMAKKDFPTDSGLTLAAFGIENTLDFSARAPSYEATYQVLEVLKHLDFLDTFPIDKVQDFVTIVSEASFAKGELICRRGEEGDLFFIILSGNVAVKDDKLQQEKVLSEFEYFGEVALLTQRNRTADIVALTDVVLLTIDKTKFASFIAGTEFEATLERLIRMRSDETWNLLNDSPYFQQLTTYQKTWVESILEPVERKGTGTIWEEGDRLDAIYIVRKGKITVASSGTNVATLARGDIIGTLQVLQRGGGARYTYTHDRSVSLFAITARNAKEFLTRNPGIAMRLQHRF